ncbi:MAG TPA: type II secretion system protein [Gemmatimonadaceae bacterium]|nr:type II secretion system protein [Gemmatimonadaceae bacterium]
MSRAFMRRRGATLIELLVTVVMLGIIASMATLAARRISAPDPADLAWLAADSLAGVVDRARAVRIDAAEGGRAVSAALHVDGRIVADSEFHVDPLAGTRSHDP